jgi:hypothetical protein
VSPTHNAACRTRCRSEADQQRQGSCSPGTPHLPGSFARRQLALPSPRATPLSTCPSASGGPVVSPTLANRMEVCCLPHAQERRLSPPTADYPDDHDYTFFGAQYRACTLDPSSFALRLPGLHVDFTTELAANLYSGGTSPLMRIHPLGNSNQFHPDLRGIPRFRVYLGTMSARL